jgi:hypothetical protein
MASIGRVKPYVFSGLDPDPNAVTLRAPGFPPPSDLPQPSDLYMDISDPDLVELWVFGFIGGSTTPTWEHVDAGSGPPGAPGTFWFTGEGPPADPYPGARTGDLYLDVITGDVYTLTGAMVTRSFYPGQPIAMV